MNKDNLILWAAYNGDIDRYIRLRRPVPIQNEWDCCVHGIYHNTGFAVWWHKQEPTNLRIRVAVAAKYIMNNILLDDLLKECPYLIFYPTIAEETTYRELVRRYPSMLPQVLRACIVADYKDAFIEFLPGLCDIDQGLYKAAARSADVAYKQKLDEVLAGRAPVELSYYSRYKEENVKSVQSSCNVLRRGMARYLSVGGGWPTIYDGATFDTAALELYMCAPKTLLATVDDLEDNDTEWFVDYSAAA